MTHVPVEAAKNIKNVVGRIFNSLKSISDLDIPRATAAGGCGCFIGWFWEGEAMHIYFGVAGLICVVYYLIICKYTGRWNSTFSGFWLMAAALNFLLGIFSGHPAVDKFLFIVMLPLWSVFVVTELCICMAMRNRDGVKVKYLIILGAQVRGTKITNSLLRRLDAALKYLEEHQETIAIVSGGQGKEEDITEACAMASYLEGHGIERQRIWLEDASASTWENLRNSRALIGDGTQPVAVVTNNFHMYRALKIGRRAGFSDIHGICASANPVLQLNYMVREFFAVIWMYVRNLSG